MFLRGTILKVLSTFLLILSTTNLVPSQAQVKKTPLTSKLEEVCGEALLPVPELIAIIVSYVQWAHVCKPNVPVYALEVLPPNTLEDHPKETVAAGLGNGEIHIIDPYGDPEAQQTTLKVLRGHSAPVTALKWLLPEKLLLSGSTVNGNAILSFNDYHTQNGDHQVNVVGLIQNKILSIFDKSDERLIFWNPQSGTPIHVIQPQTKENLVRRLMYKMPLIGSKATGVYARFINLSTKEHIDDILDDVRPETRLPNGQCTRFEIPARRTCELRMKNYQVSGCADGTCLILDLRSNTSSQAPGHTKAVRAIQAISSKLVATAGEDGAIRIWGTAPRRHIYSIDESHRGAIYALTLIETPLLPLLVSGSADGTVRIYAREMAECFASLEMEEKVKKQQEALAQIENDLQTRTLTNATS